MPLGFVAKLVKTRFVLYECEFVFVKDDDFMLHNAGVFVQCELVSA